MPRMGSRLFYLFRNALHGLSRAPVRSLLCTLTLGVALAVVGAYLLLYSNLEGMLSRWGSDLDLSVYLQDNIRPDELEALTAHLRGRPEVAELRYLSRAANLERLRLEWPQHADLFSGEIENLAEASLEVRLRPVADRPLALARLARLASAQPGVAATDFGEEDLKRVEQGLALLKSAGAVLAGLLALSALFIVGATIRLALQDRGPEIEIMKLCGATNAFIRTPLLLEGTLQGAAGGGIALALVGILHLFLLGALDELFAGAAPAGPIAFLPAEQSVALVGGGALLGALGSALGAARYLRS
jgi:cell division transport system permease protein